MLTGAVASLRVIPNGFDDIMIGDKASCQRSFNEADVIRYACITGIYPSPHLRERFVPAMLVASLISKVLGMQLPGPGSSVELSHKMEFLAPVFIGDTIIAWVEVKKKLPKHHHVWLQTFCTNQHKSLVLDGIVQMKIL